MSVIIKDMNMPVDCLACRISCKHERYLVTGRPEGCPLEEKHTGADAKHGEWIKKVSPSGNTGWWKCSECGAVIFSESDIDKYYHHAYCGVCGAYMRGDNNEAPGK